MLHRFLTLVVAVLSLTALALAQTETGQITGTVQDQTGAVIPGATVTVISSGTGATRNTTASSSGDFAVSNLLPGSYQVTVAASGFSSFRQSVVVTVGSRVGLPVKLDVGTAGTTVEVSETAAQVNTETQTLSTNVSQTQLRELPTLTRNPYDLVALSGNVSNAGAGTRGVGFSINGARQASTNVLLDGAANNNEFGANVGQAVPLDSVQEFSVLTNNFTAEFGRASGGIVNVATKSGTNEFHGTAYEFNRVSALSSNTFDNNANGVAKSTFTRNQFGYSFGGPAIKNKLFFFSSTEWIRIRSVNNTTAVVVTPQLLAASSPNTQSFFNAYGALKPNDVVLQTYSARSVCGTNAACLGNLNPATPILQRVAYSSFNDAGGGIPGNQYQTVERVDYNLSDKTQLYARYALESQLYFPGYVSNSPYQGFDTGETFFKNNILVSATHAFTSTLVSQSKAVFNRISDLQPFGAAGANLPTLYTGSSGVAQFQGVNILMPGYTPNAPGNGIPFGGPQNFVQLYQDFSWSHGKHNFRFGGSYDYQRDNRTFGAYQTAGYYLGSGTGTVTGSIARLLSGNAYQYQAAIYPQGKLPGQTVSLPLTQPNFSRSNRYNEGAVYGQDAWKLTPRFTLNIGLRWEYFGAQHNKNSALDSNFYDPANQINTPLGIRLGQVQLADNAGGLWQPRTDNFAPRIGFAYDLTGDGKTSFRGGYGIGYERNFGNVTFNVIQNPPNYETVSIFSANQTIPISPNNFGPFSGSTGTLRLPKASLRNVDSNILQAYSHFWSASLERQVTNGVQVGLDYSGSRGVHLYDIQGLNRLGFGNVYLGDPCNASGAATLAAVVAGTPNCLTYQNPQYNGINRRGSKGSSNYNSLTVRTRVNDIGHSGLTLTAAYTWSHSIDTLSSTFSDNDNFSNNNGNFVLGYLDPYNPSLDRGSSDFDLRHRVTVTAIWAVPAFKSGKGLMHQILGGWELSPIFSARTGSPYSLFDGGNSYTYSARASLNGSVDTTGVGDSQPNLTAPNLYNYQNIPNSIIVHAVNPLYGITDIGPFPANMVGRNTFTSPGFWNLSAGAYKTFSLSERFKLQLRGEAYNITNHANLYVQGNSADISAAPEGGSGFTSVTACKGCTGSTNDRRNLQLAAKFIF